MRPFRLALLFAAFVASSCAPFPAQSAAPATSWQRLGDAAGKKTIAIVFASWCVHCRDELAALETLRTRSDLRIVGVNFPWQEQYDDRGNDDAVRAYVAANAPWLTVVPGDQQLFDALGRPPKVPSVYVYDATGHLAASYDRRRTRPPDLAELTALLDRL